MSAVGACALALGLAVTMMPAGTLTAGGEAHAATTSALESSAATAAANRVSRDVNLEPDSSESLPIDAGLAAAQDAAQEVPEVSGNPKGAAISATDFSYNGLVFRALSGDNSNNVALVGFDIANLTEDRLNIPGYVYDANGLESTVCAVKIDAGQVVDNVLSAKIPTPVTSIDYVALAAAFPKLRYIEVDSANESYSSYDGVLYEQGDVEKNGVIKKVANRKLAFVPASIGKVATVALDCAEIIDKAFMPAVGLETVIVMGAVDKVAETAFSPEQLSTVTVVVNSGVAQSSSDSASLPVSMTSVDQAVDPQAAWKALAGLNVRSAVEAGTFAEVDGLVFTALADNTLSVSAADNAAVASDITLPEYGNIDGITFRVTAVADNAFKDCAAARTLVLPDGYKTIGASAFEGCTNLNAVTLPSTLQTIGARSFAGSGISEITIPPSVTSIDGEAFADCASLVAVNSGGKPYVSETALGGSASQTTVNEVASGDEIDSAWEQACITAGASMVQMPEEEAVGYAAEEASISTFAITTAGQVTVNGERPGYLATLVWADGFQGAIPPASTEALEVHSGWNTVYTESYAVSDNGKVLWIKGYNVAGGSVWACGTVSSTGYWRLNDTRLYDCGETPLNVEGTYAFTESWDFGASFGEVTVRDNLISGTGMEGFANRVPSIPVTSYNYTNGEVVPSWYTEVITAYAIQGDMLYLGGTRNPERNEDGSLRYKIEHAAVFKSGAGAWCVNGAPISKCASTDMAVGQSYVFTEVRGDFVSKDEFTIRGVTLDYYNEVTRVLYPCSWTPNSTTLPPESYVIGGPQRGWYTPYMQEFAVKGNELWFVGSYTITGTEFAGVAVSDAGGWALNGNYVKNQGRTIVKAGETYAFTEISNTVTVSYATNGGSSVASQTVPRAEASDIQSVEPTQDGYRFVGWSTDNTWQTTTPTYKYVDASGGDSMRSLTPAQDVTLYAIWAFDVKYHKFQGDYVDSYDQTFYKGKNDQTLKGDPTSEWYTSNTFTQDGWAKAQESASKDGDGYAFGAGVTENPNIAGNNAECHLYLAGAWSTRTITFHLNIGDSGYGSFTQDGFANGGSGATLTKSFSCGSEGFSIPDPASSNYNFVGWANAANTETANLGKDITPETMSTDLEYWAIWSITLNLDYNYKKTAGGPDYATTTVDIVTCQSSSKEIPMTRLSALEPSAGSHTGASGLNFMGWYSARTGQDKSHCLSGAGTFVVTPASTLYAVWAWKATFIDGRSGTTTIDYAYVQANTTGPIDLPSIDTTDPDVTFEGWTTDPDKVSIANSSVASPQTLSKDTVFYAVWPSNRVTVQFSKGVVDEYTDEAYNSSLTGIDLEKRINIYGDMSNDNKNYSFAKADSGNWDIPDWAFYYRGHQVYSWTIYKAKFTAPTTPGGSGQFAQLTDEWGRGRTIYADEWGRMSDSVKDEFKSILLEVLSDETNWENESQRYLKVVPTWVNATYRVDFVLPQGNGKGAAGASDDGDLTYYITNKDGSNQEHILAKTDESGKVVEGAPAGDYYETYTFGGGAYEPPDASRVRREGYVFKGWKDVTPYAQYDEDTDTWSNIPVDAFGNKIYPFNEQSTFVYQKDEDGATTETKDPAFMQSYSPGSFTADSVTGNVERMTWGHKLLMPVFKEKVYRVYYDPTTWRTYPIDGRYSTDSVIDPDAAAERGVNVTLNEDEESGYNGLYWTEYRYEELAQGKNLVEGASTMLANAHGIKGYDFQSWVKGSLVPTWSGYNDENKLVEFQTLKLGILEGMRQISNLDSKPEASFGSESHDQTTRLYLWEDDDVLMSKDDAEGVAGDGNASANTQPCPVTLKPYWMSSTMYPVSVGIQEPVWMGGSESTSGAPDGLKAFAGGNIYNEDGAVNETPKTDCVDGKYGKFHWLPGFGFFNGDTNADGNVDEARIGIGKVSESGEFGTGEPYGLYIKAMHREGYVFKGWGLNVADHEKIKDKDGNSVPINDFVDEHGATENTAAGSINDCLGNLDGGFTPNGDKSDQFALYISYDPTTYQAGEGDDFRPGTFKLTETGAAVMSAWDSRVTADNTAASETYGLPGQIAGFENECQWVAVWKAIPYDVVLRVPSTAVSVTDGRWVSVNDGTSGWKSARLQLHYWDTVTVPGYTPTANTFTFSGWNTRQTATGADQPIDYEVAREASEADRTLMRGGADHPTGEGANTAFTWGARFDDSGYLRVTKEIADNPKSLGGTEREPLKVGDGTVWDTSATGVSSDKDGYQDRQMWLRYKAIQIGLDAPVQSLYLCADTYDKDYTDPETSVVHKAGEFIEEPYVVGSDGRKLLESRIQFTTDEKYTSHDFVVTDVTCEPVEIEAADGTTYKGTDILDTSSNGEGKASIDDPQERCLWLSTDDTVENVKSGNWWLSRDTLDERDAYGNVGNRLTAAGTDRPKNDRLYFGFTSGNNSLTEKGTVEPGVAEADTSRFVDLTDYVLARPGSALSTSGTFKNIEATVDAQGNPVPAKRVTTFYYGLDLNKCRIDVTKGSKAYEALAGKYGEMVPLARLTFTFSVLDGASAAAEPSATPSN